jgi:hypothetical protein
VKRIAEGSSEAEGKKKSGVLGCNPASGFSEGFFDAKANYFFKIRRNPQTPISPEAIRSKLAGSGTLIPSVLAKTNAGARNRELKENVPNSRFFMNLYLLPFYLISNY